MPLPQSWIDHLFGRLCIRYGGAFLRQWPDTDPDIVKADWADVLDGVKGDSITYALKYLPDQPVNAIKFRDLCRRAPTPDVPALPAPNVKADPERVRGLMAKLKGHTLTETPAEQCARNILRIADCRGGKLSSPQRAQLVAMGYLEAA